MFKRVLTVFLCFTVVISVFAGCDKKDVEKDVASESVAETTVKVAEESKNNSTKTTTSSNSKTIQDNLFNNTYWFLCFGQSLGSMYTAKFYKNGTFDAICHGNVNLYNGTYKINNDKIFISVDNIKNIAFIKVNDEFCSENEQEMQVGSDHYSLSMTTKEDYLQLYNQYENQKNNASKQEIQQVENNTTSTVEQKGTKPRYGKYSADFYWNRTRENKSYAYITLKENGQFTIESNYDLKNSKDCEPFTKNGKYVLENLADGMWLILYIDNKKYLTYAVGTDGTFFQDQEVVFNYTN